MVTLNPSNQNKDDISHSSELSSQGILKSLDKYCFKFVSFYIKVGLNTTQIYVSSLREMSEKEKWKCYTGLQKLYIYH